MQLVNYRAVPRNSLMAAVAPPTETRIDDHAFRNERRTVAFVEAQVGILGTNRVAEARVVPFQLAHMGTCIRIEQQFIRIKAMPFVWNIWPVYAIAIHRPWPKARQIPVPDFFREFWQIIALQFCSSRGIKNAKFHARGIRGEQREIYALSIPGGAQRVRGPNVHPGYRRRHYRSIHRNSWRGTHRIGRGRTECTGYQV